MPKMTDLESTGLGISERLDIEPKQKYGLFGKLSLGIFGSYGVVNKPHIFITRSNQHIQEVNRHFDGTLNRVGLMVFEANKEQN